MIRVVQPVDPETVCIRTYPSANMQEYLETILPADGAFQVAADIIEQAVRARNAILARERRERAFSPS